MIRKKEGVAHYAGVGTCGSIWACPVCSAKIRNTRAEDVSTATANWDREGNTVLMAAFTAPHDLGMALQPLMKAISSGFTYCLSGRPWMRLKERLGIVGQIRALEVTHGEHGWHPHLHVLIYIKGGIDAQGLAELTIHLRERWKTWITRKGYRPPHDLHGVDIQRCYSAEEAGAYIAKTQDGKGVGNEMTRGDLKQGRKGSRTPFEILDDFRWTGDARDLALWGEYERATHKKQAITWSGGLRKLLLPDDQEEKKDEEIAEEEVGGDDVALLEPDTWRAVVRVPGLPAYLLERVERDGIQGLQQALRRNGITEALPVQRKEGQEE
ncbi:hypothetical protein GCM10007147_45950 [Nocardiopsis kunsanensis]|uniref:Replication protein n=1 Tax=Nocardiopsis kunsanensis TaxID=141693 RepID=A0A918XMA2_9ACTN|nr:protein rep [Nocardiopsis kunsanensis]GHD37747.1 hypothetical protein GCM10007147_45950 [Nocardiopsis kunsanensis]